MIVILAMLLAATGTQPAQTVSVLYAGSLVTPMEGPIKAALASEGIDFEGEAGGSKMLANLIASGSKNPDVFVCVDPKLVTGLGSKVSSAVVFAATSLGVAWSSRSKYAPLFDGVAAGHGSLLDALQTPGLTIGRTDPELDPKGAYTVEGMTMLAGSQRERAILGDDRNAAQTFPEQDLLARIETGQADVGFFYKTEALARGLHFMPLPGAAAMSDKIVYAVAVMKNAPHPATARAFVDFLLTGHGRPLLQAAGLEYFPEPHVLRR